MTTLINAPEGAAVKVARIGPAPEFIDKLRELGINQGAILTILKKQHKRWLYPGLLRINVNGEVCAISEPLAEMVLVEKDGKAVRLTELICGGKGKVFSEHGRVDEREILSKIGIGLDAVIEVIGQFPNDILVFDVGGQERKLSPNVATQIWISLDGKEIQLNYLPPSMLCEIVDTVSDGPGRQALHDIGFIEGQPVELKRHERVPVDQNVEDCALFLEFEGSPIRLKLELARQVWVEELQN